MCVSCEGVMMCVCSAATGTSPRKLAVITTVMNSPFCQNILDTGIRTSVQQLMLDSWKWMMISSTNQHLNTLRSNPTESKKNRAFGGSTCFL